MAFLRSLFLNLFRRRQAEQDLDEEVRAHLDLLVDQQRAAGLDDAAARRAARLELGGVDQVKEAVRDVRPGAWLDDVWQDMRYGARMLARNPGFTAVAVMTLAIGIGVNAAVFTVTNAVLFKGFPSVVKSDRIVYLASRGVGGPFVSYPDFDDWQNQAKSFEGMAAVNAIRITLDGLNGDEESVNGTAISANAFRLLGQRPLLGRDFASSDETRGASPVAIMSYGLWERRYGKDPAVVGQAIQINGAPTAVVGVMPQGFSFPRQQDLWIPLVPTTDLAKREARGLWFVFGRLADGVTVESARAEMDTIGRQLATAYPRTNRDVHPDVETFHEFFVGANATLIYVAMLGAVGFVLLIACANVANLLLARAIGRSREMSVRIALGAGRWRIIRQLLIESLMLSTVGGVVGWWIAGWSVRAYQLTTASPGWFGRVLDYAMDIRVFVYILAISIGTGVLFGLAPVSRLSALDINATLKNAGHGSAAGRRGTRLAALLVIGQMALAVVLLAGAGMMIRSFLNIYTADVGVNTTDILTLFLELPDDRYPRAETQISFFERLTVHLAEIPGVVSIAIADRFPTQGARYFAYERRGAPSSDEHLPTVGALTIGPAYFRTLGVNLLSGREFASTDAGSGVRAAIVNQRFARTTWPGKHAVGKRLRLLGGAASDAWLTVVGVAPDIMQADTTRQQFDPLVYLPYRQRPTRGMWVFARTSVPPEGLAPAFRRELHAIDSHLPVFDLLPLNARLAQGYSNPALFGGLFLTFAAIALLLASIGLYAVIAHAVGQRTQEIGIRMALGAAAHDIRGLVLRQGLLPVGVGLAVGLVLSVAVNRLLRTQLVRVSPSDPMTLWVVSTVLIVAAALACLIPAYRATSVDPMVALRHD